MLTKIKTKPLTAFDFSNNIELFKEIENFFDKNIITKSYPKSNFLEKDDKFILELSAPGIDKENLEISLDEFKLNISFKKEELREVEGEYTMREFYCNSFNRTFSIPKSSDFENIKSRYENGILFIEIPKKDNELNKKRIIKIS